MSDYELMQSIARGQTRAFAELVDRYQSLVFGLSLKYLNNREKAEDMAQDVWVKIAESADQFVPQLRANSLAKSWILTITRNLCLNHLKSSYSKTEALPENFDVASSELSATELLEQFESKEKLNLLISELDPRARSVLLLFITEEKNLSEISELLDMSLSHVKVTLHRTREKMKRELSSNE